VDAAGLPVKLLFSKTGVVIGLVHTYLPFMTLSLIGSLNRIDPRVEEAAASLGSPPLQVFGKVTLPQTLPGLATGSVLVFVLSASAFVAPQMLGGGTVTTLVSVIYDQATTAQNWPLASAAGVVLLVVTLVVLSIHALVMRRATHD
jgi:putative spermidine/putrescine transport system permease protein